MGGQFVLVLYNSGYEDLLLSFMVRMWNVRISSEQQVRPSVTNVTDCRMTCGLVMHWNCAPTLDIRVLFRRWREC